MEVNKQGLTTQEDVSNPQNTSESIRESQNIPLGQEEAAEVEEDDLDEDDLDIDESDLEEEDEDEDE